AGEYADDASMSRQFRAFTPKMRYCARLPSANRFLLIFDSQPLGQYLKGNTSNGSTLVVSGEFNRSLIWTDHLGSNQLEVVGSCTGLFGNGRNDHSLQVNVPWISSLVVFRFRNCVASVGPCIPRPSSPSG